MNSDEQESLIKAYVSYASAGRESPQSEQYFWAITRLSELISRKPTTNNELQKIWEILLEIGQQPLSEKAMSNFAAGPLEDILAYHGEAIIERVETQARRDPSFKHLLGGVWQNAMSNSIWKRVQAARKRA